VFEKNESADIKSLNGSGDLAGAIRIFYIYIALALLNKIKNSVLLFWHFCVRVFVLGRFHVRVNAHVHQLVHVDVQAT
jgi:hypothetical protein